MFQKLPTKEDIIAMTDHHLINEWRDSIDESIKKIETDLQFSSGDIAWEKRAKTALSYHRCAMGHLTRRLKGLMGKSVSVDDLDAKINKKQEAKNNRLLNIEEEKIKNEKRKIASEEKRMQHLERMDFYSCFFKASKCHLDPDLFSRITTLAGDMQRASINESEDK